MPIYEYLCLQCCNVYDKLIPESERNDEQECTKCGSMDSELQLSSGHFKVPGGYDGRLK